MKKGYFICLSVVVCMIMLEMLSGEAKGSDMQKSIAGKVIRFHVIANSDSEKDQELKYMVRDRVMEYTKDLLSHAGSLAESENILMEHESEILSIAQNCVTEAGYDYTVTAGMEHTYFPVKSYGEYAFPAGEYEAYCIRIGTSKGKNWWCVLYPPLCFIDIASSHTGACEEAMNGVLSPEEMAYLSGETPRFQFKYLTFLNEWFDL